MSALLKPPAQEGNVIKNHSEVLPHMSRLGRPALSSDMLNSLMLQVEEESGSAKVLVSQSSNEMQST